ncbi:MAG: EMC3/TMCO1 family protein [Candidatus Aenigmarchaeota archaeon]|nr:EMC3/TMCO1 family protein [Candidatus Aenigmarchaeota archaeon]
MDLTTIGISPIFMVFLVGGFISIFMSIINWKVLGTEKAKEVKKRMQDIRAKMLETQKSGDTKKTNEHLAELMKINSEYMRFTFKPMIVSLVLVILILPFLKSSYTGKVVGIIPNVLPAVGGIKLDWFWWYFISTFVISLIAKKMLGI